MGPKHIDPYTLGILDHVTREYYEDGYLTSVTYSLVGVTLSGRVDVGCQVPLNDLDKSFAMMADAAILINSKSSNNQIAVAIII